LTIHLPHDIKINDLLFDLNPIEIGPQSKVNVTLSITNQGTNDENVIWKLLNKSIAEKKLATGTTMLEVGETEIIIAEISVKDFIVGDNEIKSKINFSDKQEKLKKNINGYSSYTSSYCDHKTDG